MKRLTLVALMLAGCGLSAKDEPAPTKSSTSSTTQPLKCDSEPIDNGNGTATSIGCSFEQQWQNISSNGTKFTAQVGLTAAGAPLGVTVTAECGGWVLGTDLQGVTVFVNKTDGEVRSHGSLHPGFATSTLPSVVALPIELR